MFLIDSRKSGPLIRASPPKNIDNCHFFSPRFDVKLIEINPSKLNSWLRSRMLIFFTYK